MINCSCVWKPTTEDRKSSFIFSRLSADIARASGWPSGDRNHPFSQQVVLLLIAGKAQV